MSPTPAEITRLAQTVTVDLTTMGRRSGEPRTVEIWWFHVGGRFIITGTPGRRDWLANVRANPAVTISVDGEPYRGSAVEVTDSTLRRTVFADPRIGWYRTQTDLDRLVAVAPMIEIRFE